MALLAAGFYIDTCLAVIAFVHLPPQPLPWFCLPPPPPIIEERNPYENDCWGQEDDYCWYWEYEI